MIYVRGIDISQFPDGTPHIKKNPSISIDSVVRWHYHEMSEFPIVCMLGCVRGGADWSVVEHMIEEIFKDIHYELWKLD